MECLTYNVPKLWGREQDVLANTPPNRVADTRKDAIETPSSLVKRAAWFVQLDSWRHYVNNIPRSIWVLGMHKNYIIILMYFVDKWAVSSNYCRQQIIHEAYERLTQFRILPQLTITACVHFSYRKIVAWNPAPCLPALDPHPSPLLQRFRRLLRPPTLHQQSNTKPSRGQGPYSTTGYFAR